MKRAAVFHGVSVFLDRESVYPRIADIYRVADVRWRRWEARKPGVSIHKVRTDCVIGWAAEEAVCKIARYPVIQRPNWALGDVGHSADIVTISPSGKLVTVGVKSCPANEFEPSWSFEATDRLESDYYVFCKVVYLDNISVEVVGWSCGGEPLRDAMKDRRDRAQGKKALYISELERMAGDGYIQISGRQGSHGGENNKYDSVLAR